MLGLRTDHLNNDWALTPTCLLCVSGSRCWPSISTSCLVTVDQKKKGQGLSKLNLFKRCPGCVRLVSVLSPVSVYGQRAALVLEDPGKLKKTALRYHQARGLKKLDHLGKTNGHYRQMKETLDKRIKSLQFPEPQQQVVLHITAQLRPEARKLFTYVLGSGNRTQSFSLGPDSIRTSWFEARRVTEKQSEVDVMAGLDGKEEPETSLMLKSCFWTSYAFPPLWRRQSVLTLHGSCKNFQLLLLLYKPSSQQEELTTLSLSTDAAQLQLLLF
ncbi:hypothetical protein Q8A73_017960 [Channa argus]|nr:hypothetical protein Q8A73_017960 [Channa argus]